MSEIPNLEIASTSIYDEERIYPNCTVQVWRNSVTGEESWGWFENPTEDDLDDIIDEVKSWD